MSAPMTSSSANPSSAPSTDEDWPAQAADAIVKVVDNVRDQTTRRAETAAKAIQYGPAIGMFGLVIAVVVTIGTFRAIERLVIWIASLLGFDGIEPMWAIYTFFGLVSTFIGLRFWKKART